MRLYHVSEESNIEIFHPRIPYRKDLPKDKGLVWAIDEAHLPNFLTPRDCPRVTYRIGENTTSEDKKRFFSSSTFNHAVIIEAAWFDILRNTTLYIYEFNPDSFVMQDKCAGYYVSRETEIPIDRYVITDLVRELVVRNVEFRLVDNLHEIAEEVKNSTLEYSLCRMANAAHKIC